MSPAAGTFTLVTIVLSILIGGLTFTGSLMAYGKLSREIIGSGKPVMFKGQQIVNSLIVLGILGQRGDVLHRPGQWPSGLYVVIGLALVFGVMAVIPIGGADMPVVISLLNSYSGLAACAAGFAINNNILIVAGSLVGASGIILTQIMCKAMNRSLATCCSPASARSKATPPRWRARSSPSSWRTPSTSWKPPAAWPWSPVTVWRWPRPSTW